MRFIQLVIANFFIAVVATMAIPVVAYSQARINLPCEETLLGYRSLLKFYVENPEELRIKLDHKMQGIHPAQLLGAGSSGTVLKVYKGDNVYALKIFGPERNYSEDEYLRNKLAAAEVGEAIAIQFVLGELGYAPKILGLIKKETLQEWFAINRSRLSDIYGRVGRVASPRARFGLLMEAVGGISTKLPLGPTVRLTEDQWQSVLVQASNIEMELDDLGIVAYDMDSVVTPNAQVKLVDLSWYRFNPEIRWKNRFLVDAVSSLRTVGKIIIE